MNISVTPIDQYQHFTFSATTREGHQVEHPVYHQGSGPPLVLIQELPGIGQQTLYLADKLVAAGFEVIMPHLFGPIGRTRTGMNLLRVFCMRREFKLFSANDSSPVVDWLKALCRKVRDDRNAKGVGVIGMCLTGNFAISLMADDSVLASVVSQPAMPIGKMGALHMSPEEIEQIKRRVDGSNAMRAYRFDKDPLCTATKFNCIHQALNGDGVNRINLEVLPGRRALRIDSGLCR